MNKDPGPAGPPIDRERTLRDTKRGGSRGPWKRNNYATGYAWREVVAPQYDLRHRGTGLTGTRSREEGCHEKRTVAEKHGREP